MTDDNQIAPELIAVIQMIVDDMTLIEANTMNLCLMLDMNPVDRMGYDKAKSLFTEGNGTKMHSDTQRVFQAIVTKMVKEAKES